jgi:hypothetical protein
MCDLERDKEFTAFAVLLRPCFFFVSPDAVAQEFMAGFALLRERRVGYVGLIGGAAIKSTEDQSGAGMGSIAFDWETSHTFWIGTHLLDAATGAIVCSWSQAVDASTSGSAGIILFTPLVLHWGIDAAEYWRAAAWRTGFDAGGYFWQAWWAWRA